MNALLQLNRLRQQQQSVPNLYTLANAANPNNESNATTGCGGSGTWSSVSSTPTPVNGGFCLKWTATAGGQISTITQTGLSINTTYYLRFRYYIPASVTARMQVYYSVSSGFTQENVVEMNVRDAWTYVFVEFKTNGSTSQMVMRPYLDSGGVAGDWYAMDDFKLQTVPFAYTNLYTESSAISIPNEANSVPGSTFTVRNTDTSWSSVASDDGAWTYMAQLTHSGSPSSAEAYINLSGIPTGVPLQIQLTVKEVGANVVINYSTGDGWNQYPTSTINIGGLVHTYITANASTSTPRIRISDSTNVASENINVYQLGIRQLP